VLIAANADSVFARLAAAMGQPALAGDERYATHHARGTNMVELDQLIAAWTATLEADDLLAHLSEHKVPAGRVYTAADALTDPHYLAREMVLRATSRTGWDVPMTGVVPKFTRTPGGVGDVGPELGEHTRAVLAELAGVDDEEWDDLAAAGVAVG
jgi:formyl-CoA transferase/succinyl-CoA--D-citramalate CoA-transferase